MKSLLYNGNCLDALDALYRNGIDLPFVFADPPDNLGLMYDGYRDKIPDSDYRRFLNDILGCMDKHDVCWLSYYNRYDPIVMSWINANASQWQKVLWRFTFGQHRETEFGSGHRPIVRLSKVDLSTYVASCRIESGRQRLGDSRANPEGRVPDDVWDFPRVTGNALERRTWHPTQHPEALLNRIVTSSGGRDLRLVTDLFAGTGSLLRVAKDLGVPSFGCEQSKFYCENIALSVDCEITTDLSRVVDYVSEVLNK